MRLTYVTFTGIDERTDLKRLMKLQQRYPFAEFGVLLSYNYAENGCRFPDPAILSDLSKLGLNLSAHFCGTAAIDIIRNKRFRVYELCNNNTRIFKRCQLNLDATDRFFELRRYSPMPFISETIFQMVTPDLCRRFLNGQTPQKVSYLIDGSGGAGIDTPIDIVKAPGVHIGYAGGIGPDNVEVKLRTLLDTPSDGRFWIDMETRVRTISDSGEWFDLDKVEHVLEICEEVLNK